MGKSKLKILYLFIALLVAIFLIKNLYTFITNHYEFELASEGDLTQSVDMNGMILHNETVIKATTAGRVIFNCYDNERVHVGSNIASVFSGNVDDNLQYQLDDINSQLSILQQSTSNTTYYAVNDSQQKQQLANSAKNIIAYANSNQYSSITNEKLSMFNLIDTSTVAEKQQKIQDLQNQKANLESQINANKQDVLSPVSGVFISTIDGYENLFDVNNRDSVLPSQINFDSSKRPLTKTDVQIGDVICKVVDNYTWYYLGIVDSKFTSQVNVGDIVTLSFPNISSQSVTGTIDNINQAENGQNVIVFLCRQDIAESYTVRETSAVMQFKTYSGIKLAKSAIYVVNGQTGVYIVNNNLATFKKVNVLYSDGNQVIIDENNSELKLYDEVVVGGKGLTEGKKVK